MPNEPLRTLVLRKLPRFTWFVTLKISHRAWMREVPRSLNSLTKFMSNCANLGPRAESLPHEPNLPTAGTANAWAAFVIADRVVFRSGKR